MAATGAAAPTALGGFDPFRSVWALLCNAKFALTLIGVAVVMLLVAVVVPQMPAPMRDNPAARSAWVELQREDLGPFAGVFDRTGLFEIYVAPWFTGLWVLITIAVTVCTVSRLRPTHRLVRAPRREVPDRFFATAHHRAEFSHEHGPEAVATALRRRRYRVEQVRQADGATRLFAERFSWSLYGTFVSHLALLIFLVGGLLTAFAGFQRTLALAESKAAAPLFDNPGPGQIFVTMEDAHRGIDEDGNIVDFRSAIEVRQGDVTKRCTVTVNGPCNAFGYKFHQAAFFDDLAKLRIVTGDGRVLFDDTLDFENEVVAVPRVRVLDPAGRLLFEGDIPQAGTDPGELTSRADDQALGVLRFALAGGALEAVEVVSWRVVDGEIRLAFDAASRAAGRVLAPGEAAAFPEYRIELIEGRNIPAITVGDLPGAAEGAQVAVQMPTRGETRYLAVAGLGTEVVELPRGQETPVGSLRFTFGGQLDGAGIDVRRDPGDTFIWAAVGLAIGGLSITFYVPRRRVWAKVTPERTYLAGIAEKQTRLGRELRQLGAELGAADALSPEDLEDDR
ncbi:MAG: cytochrome c biogenesis protein ResB [Dehalococcoidia bacterium]